MKKKVCLKVRRNLFHLIFQKLIHYSLKTTNNHKRGFMRASPHHMPYRISYKWTKGYVELYRFYKFYIIILSYKLLLRACQGGQKFLILLKPYDRNIYRICDKMVLIRTTRTVENIHFSTLPIHGSKDVIG